MQLDIEGDTLTLGVEKEQQHEEQKAEAGITWHRVERSSQYQRRALRLPDNADLSKVSAKYEDGVLMVDIPKKAMSEPKSTRVSIA